MRAAAATHVAAFGAYGVVGYKELGFTIGAGKFHGASVSSDLGMANDVACGKEPNWK